MGDLSTREQIRAEATERIARAIYAAGVAPEFRSSWETVSEATRQAVTREATWYVDALGDLLPTGVTTAKSYDLVGGNDSIVRQYTTDWIEVPE